uniref:Uncharacterized protein n=1 Tax=Panagrolaimus sp. JU765 TaxID=591449 RepID=A0AC34QXE8_9BILA
MSSAETDNSEYFELLIEREKLRANLISLKAANKALLDEDARLQNEEIENKRKLFALKLESENIVKLTDAKKMQCSHLLSQIFSDKAYLDYFNQQMEFQDQWTAELNKFRDVMKKESNMMEHCSKTLENEEWNIKKRNKENSLKNDRKIYEKQREAAKQMKVKYEDVVGILREELSSPVIDFINNMVQLELSGLEFGSKPGVIVRKPLTPLNGKKNTNVAVVQSNKSMVSSKSPKCLTPPRIKQPSAPLLLKKPSTPNAKSRPLKENNLSSILSSRNSLLNMESVDTDGFLSMLSPRKTTPKAKSTPPSLQKPSIHYPSTPKKLATPPRTANVHEGVIHEMLRVSTQMPKPTSIPNFESTPEKHLTPTAVELSDANFNMNESYGNFANEDLDDVQQSFGHEAYNLLGTSTDNPVFAESDSPGNGGRVFNFISQDSDHNSGNFFNFDNTRTNDENPDFLF